MAPVELVRQLRRLGTSADPGYWTEEDAAAVVAERDLVLAAEIRALTLRDVADSLEAQADKMSAGTEARHLYLMLALDLRKAAV